MCARIRSTTVQPEPSGWQRYRRRHSDRRSSRKTPWIVARHCSRRSIDLISDKFGEFSGGSSAKGGRGGGQALGVGLAVQSASTPDEIKTAFTMLTRQRIGALLIAAEPFFFSRRCQLAALASDHALLAGYPSREYAEAGGLFSYGPSFPDAWRLAGNYAGRILKGEKAGDLPVQQSMRIRTDHQYQDSQGTWYRDPSKTPRRRR